MPQGSILGPLLFNIDFIDLFYKCEESDIASYADETTPCSCESDTQSVIAELQITANKIFHWFDNNHLKANSGKSHLLLSTKTSINVSIGDVSLTTSTTETLLGIKFDSELTFDQHFSSVCSKASKKLHALGRSSIYMSLNGQCSHHIETSQLICSANQLIGFYMMGTLAVKGLIESQYDYCPLIWMSHSRTMNNKISRINERPLRLVYSDYSSNFDELLKKYGSFSIRDRNIQT